MYTRSNPSPRYRVLHELYRQMHREGETTLGIPAHQTFSGLSLMPYARRIKHLIQRTGACTILDYGSGKGQQYRVSPLQIEGEGTWHNLVDYWEVAAVYCYDPHYVPFSRMPTARYDGVICTDVLEHCPEEDLPWILGEIFGFAGRFVFASVACYSARKRLPNGENAHCTVRPPAWWRGVIERAAAERGGGLLWEFIFISLADGAKNQLAERLANWEERPSGAKPDSTSLAALELEQATKRYLAAQQLDEAAESIRRLSRLQNQRLNVAVCSDSPLDPGRPIGDPYIAKLTEVEVDTGYWTVFDHARAYPKQSYGRNFANSRLVKQRVSQAGDRYLVTWEPPKLTIGEPCVFVGSDENYAHWVLRSLLKLWLVDLDPKLRGLPWVVGSVLTPVQSESLEALGVSDSGLLRVAAHDVIHFKTLHVPTQMLGNRGFTNGVNWLRDKFSRWISPPSEARDLIYVARADASRRRLVNEREVFESLSPLGFRRVVLAGMTLRGQIAVFSRARCVVAPHGAGLANLVFSPPGTRVVEITSTNLASMRELRGLAAQLGQQVESVVSNDYVLDEARGRVANPMHWDFRVSVREVRAAALRALG